VLEAHQRPSSEDAALFGGHRGLSFPERIVQRVKEGGPLRVVSDQKINPTYTATWPVPRWSLLKREHGNFPRGVRRLLLLYDFARAVWKRSGLLHGGGGSTSDFAAPAQRPVNGCISSERSTSPDWRESLHEWAGRSEKEASGLKKARPGFLDTGSELGCGG